MTRGRNVLLALALLLAVAGVAPAAHAADPTWRLEQPTAPGAQRPGPLGPPAALVFAAPRRGLLQVQGNGGSPAGLWTFDGAHWSLLSTVCGSHPNAGAIAVAGPDDFWAVADPAPGAVGDPSGAPDFGTTLCHVQDGRVIASYAQPPGATTRYFPMRAGLCRGADDCWFGGDSGATPDGARQGAFHLHWDGTQLTELFGDQQRAVTAMATQGGDVLETVALGQRALHYSPATPAVPEDPPSLLHALSAGAFVNAPLAPLASAPAGYAPNQFCCGEALNHLEEHELDAMATSPDSGELWLVGGAARSGPLWGLESPLEFGGGGDAPPRLPIGAVREPDGTTTQLRFDDDLQTSLGPVDPNGDARRPFELTGVAPIPGRLHEAWLTALQYDGTAPGDNEGGSPLVLRVRFDPAAPVDQPNATLLEGPLTPPGGDGKGGARQIVCPAAGDCWMVTGQGWLFHWSDGSPEVAVDDPAYDNLIATRPPDGRSPSPLPDTDAVDDSQRFRPAPTVIVVPAPPAPVATPSSVAITQSYGALISHARTRAVGQRAIELRFELARPARVGVVGELYGRVVGRAPARALVPGDQVVRMAVDPKRRPKRLRFSTRELALTAPTLTTASRRSAGGVLATATAPAAGRLTVSVVDGSRVAARRTATLVARTARTVTLPLATAVRGHALRVAFSFVPVPGTAAGVPRLAGQRLLAPPPRPAR